MKKLLMPSQKKVYNVGGGWYSKEAADGARALYHASFVPIDKGWDNAALLLRGRNPRAPRGGATVYSDSWTKVRAGRRNSPINQSAKLTGLPWNFASLPAGNVADVLVCNMLYKGDIVIGGNVAHTALDATGGPATGSVGTYAVLADGISLGAVSSAAKFLAATDWDAAGNNALAPTIALGYQYEATADFFIVVVNSVGAFATAGQICGHLTVART